MTQTGEGTARLPGKSKYKRSDVASVVADDMFTCQDVPDVLVLEVGRLVRTLCSEKLPDRMVGRAFKRRLCDGDATSER